MGSRLPRCLPEWPGHHGQLGRPRRQGLSGVEHLPPQPQEQHSSQREEWQDRRRFHSRWQHAVGLERFRGPVGAQRPRDPTLPAIRNLVGTGAGADPPSRLHHLNPVDLVALQTRHSPRDVLKQPLKFLKYLQSIVLAAKYCGLKGLLCEPKQLVFNDLRNLPQSTANIGLAWQRKPLFASTLRISSAKLLKTLDLRHVSRIPFIFNSLRRTLSTRLRIPGANYKSGRTSGCQHTRNATPSIFLSKTSLTCA